MTWTQYYMTTTSSARMQGWTRLPARPLHDLGRRGLYSDLYAWMYMRTTRGAHWLVRPHDPGTLANVWLTSRFVR